MSDIIEALREGAGYSTHDQLLQEAADEIENLRAELESWRNRELEKANRAMYAEMLKWCKQGHQIVLLVRDGENITMRPVA